MDGDTQAGAFTPLKGRVVRLADLPLSAAQEGEQSFRASLSPSTLGMEGVVGGWYRVAAGKSNHLDMHPDKDEFYFIHRGRATMLMAGERTPMAAGDTVFVPHGVEHQILDVSPDEDLELFYFFADAQPPFPVRDASRYPVVTFAPAEEG